MTRIEAIYTRQSIYKEESLSVETQIEKCKIHLKDQNHYKVYDQDKGKSGKNTDRHDLQVLINDIKSEKISKVLVYKLDRISRNVKDFYNLYDLMQQYNTEFYSVTEAFDTATSMGRAMMGILAIFAQLERENTVKRVTDNYYSRIKINGSWPGGPAPYGFINAKAPDNKATLVINENEIEAVKIAFDLYSNQNEISLAMVGRILEEKGFCSRKRKTFDNVTIARMLQNPVYVKADRILYKYFQSKNANFVNEELNWNGLSSCHIVGKTQGNSNIRNYTTLKEQTIYLTNFKGIIESNVYINIQNRLALNEQICRANKPTNMQELAGLIKCKKCGYAIKMNCKPYLSCYGRCTLHLCDVKFKNVKFEDIQNDIGIRIQKKLSELNSIISKKHLEIQSYSNEISTLKNEMENIIQLLALGGLTADIVKKQLEEKQKKIYEAELQLQLLQNAYLDNADFESIKNVSYFDLDLSAKKLIVRDFIRKIDLCDNGDIEIHWKL